MAYKRVKIEKKLILKNIKLNMKIEDILNYR